MARGGSRPGAGRPRKGDETVKPAAVKREARAVKLSPLDYMLAVMNDEDVDQARRDRMAQAAAPYVHPKMEAQAKGKKEERQEAAERAAGKFAPPQPPKLVVDNKR